MRALGLSLFLYLRPFPRFLDILARLTDSGQVSRCLADGDADRCPKILYGSMTQIQDV